MSEPQQQRAWDAAPEWPNNEIPVADAPVMEPVPAPMVEPPAPVVAEAPAPVVEAVPVANDTPADAMRDRFFAGAGVRFKGDLEVASDLVLSGSFEGTAKARRLIVSREGVFNGACVVDEAEIEGIADGTLTVTGALIVRSGGVVRGKISYGEIELARGAHLEGEITKHVPQAEAAPEPVMPESVAPVAVATAPAAPAPVDMTPVELSTDDILAAPEPVAAPAPVPRVLMTEAETAQRRRFGIFGR